MHPGRGVVALVVLVAALGLGAARAESTASSDGAASTGSTAPGAKKKAHKPTSKKRSSKSKTSPETGSTRSKPTRLARQKSPLTINEDIKLTPFPSHAGAAKKALAQNRRDHLDDAENAARSPQQGDRWQTVLFHLRDLDARSDSEGCFWRLVAYYRLGQIERARTLRASCDFAPKDAALIEAEDEQAAAMQPPTTVVVDDKTPAAPVENPAAYTGPAPARAER